MKRAPKIAIGISISICLFLALWPRLESLRYLNKQKQLAELLQVKMADYRQPDFPYEYFSSKFREGMTTDEVHALMIGYNKVLKCSDYAEVYYYFGMDETSAFRYQIIYDNNEFVSFVYDEPGYRLIYTGNCAQGLLGE